MSAFHETFDRTGIPPHIAYHLLKEALREESKRNIFAKQMHKTVSELARQGIDDEGNQIIKEETEQPPLPSSNPPLDHQLAQAKKQKIKQAELDAGFQIALQYLGRGTIMDLQSSPSLPKNVNGILELAESTHMEPIDAVQQSIQYVKSAQTQRATLARIHQIVTYSPSNFPTEFQKVKFAKEAINNKAEFVPSSIGFDNAFPEHRAQTFNGDSGWHTWMVQRIDNITAEAARISDQTTHVNNLQQEQVEEWNTHLDNLNQRLQDLETETVNHVATNQQGEDKKKKKKKQIDKSKYKFYCFLHGHTTNQNHTSATCTKLIVDETFRFGKNQGKLITAAMKGATEPGTIDGAEGSTDYFTPYYSKSNSK